MMYPKISIITPSYNQGRFLEKTILSVLEQGYPNLEYIIIDGGSSDGSVEIIKKYADRLAYWVSEPDHGQSHAINKGFTRATGEIFGWLNSDDWYHPGALLAVAEAFAANPEAGAVVGGGEMVDETCNQLLYKSPNAVDFHFLCHWLDDFFWQPSCLFTRVAWERCGPLDESIHFAMDLDLWFRIANNFVFVTTPAMLSGSLRHADAKTTAHSYLTVFDAFIVIVRHGGELSARNDIVTYCNYLTEKDQNAVLEIGELKKELQNMDYLLNERNLQLIRSKNLEMEVSAIYDSLSWKITRPLRWLNDKIIKIRNSS